LHRVGLDQNERTFHKRPLSLGGYLAAAFS
jgi:hypothetical protein